MSNHPIVDVLNNKLGGIISSGCHSEGEGACCILEVVSVAKGIPWTDHPGRTGMPDIRGINDAFRDPGKRTLAMVRLGVALYDYSEWSEARRLAFAIALVLYTVREVLAPTLRLVG